jgi:hypothetical protein
VRFYAIKIIGAGPGFPPTPGAWIEGAQFCTALDSKMGLGFQNDPSAMRCVLQMELTAVSGQLALVRLWGIDTQMIDQAADLTNLKVEVYGGFWPGLPLATWESTFTGLLYSGVVQSAYGNWEGSDMTLDMYLMGGDVKASDAQAHQGTSVGDIANMPDAPGRLVARSRRVGRQLAPKQPPSATQFDFGGDVAGAVGGIISSFGSGGWGLDPENLIHDFKEGMNLADSLKQTLSNGFKSMPFVNLIKDGLKLNYHDAGAYQTVDQLMGYIKPLSKELASGDKDYPGIDLYAVKGKLIGADGTKAHSHVFLQIWDMIGNVTWGGTDGKVPLVNFTVPMRADIFPTCVVHLPDNVWQNIAPTRQNQYLAGAPPTVRERMHFQGPIFVLRVMINGDSRHPSGKSWALSVTGRADHYSNWQQPALSDRGGIPGGSYNAGAPSPGRLAARGRGVG